MELLSFNPVPTRARHDGWSAADQREFIRRLARGHLVNEAAESLGHSRQSAYALRKRPDAAEFAAAWEAAQALGRQVCQARRSAIGPELESGLETVWAPRYYRGRFVGFVRRQDHRAAMQMLLEMDQQEEDLRILSKLTR